MVDADEILNDDLLQHVLTEVFETTSRRTSSRFAFVVLSEALEALKTKYLFLNAVRLKGGIFLEYPEKCISVSSDLNAVDILEVGKAIESLIRVISMNMKNEEAGLYYITELKQQISHLHYQELLNRGIDLDTIQLEQHYLYKKKKQQTKLPKDYKTEAPNEQHTDHYINLVNYNWGNIGFWTYDGDICTIFDKKGKVLDKLPLDKIVKEYMVKLTGFKQLPDGIGHAEKLNEKEYEFLHLLYSRDINADEAMELLHISRAELNVFIRKLLVTEALQYVSHDELLLTNTGIQILVDNFFKKPEKKKQTP